MVLFLNLRLLPLDAGDIKLLISRCFKEPSLMQKNKIKYIYIEV